MNKFLTILIVTVCIASQSTAQTANSIAQKYKFFKAALPTSRLHFVFNQDRYAAGDTVFFKAYFLKKNLQPVAGRQFIDVNLIAPGGKRMQHFLFPVLNGVGANQVILPDTLNAGVYLLAAYSSWMKNFDTPPMFTKEIVVVGEKRIATSPNPDDITVSVRPDNRVTILSKGFTRYQQLTLIVTNKDNVTFTSTFTQGVRDGISIELPPGTLQPGVNILHVVNKLWMTVGTGRYYVHEREPVAASIEVDGTQLQTRKNGTLTITVRDENKQPLQGEFSVKVLNAAVTDSTHLTFAEDLAMSAPAREPWRQIILRQATNPKYNYTTDLAKTGRVFLPGGEPAEPGTRMFFYLQGNEMMMQTTTTAGGRIRLLIPDVTGDDELFYMAENFGEEIPGVTIVWDQTSISLPDAPASIELNEPDAYGIFAANKKMIDKAFEFNESTPTGLTSTTERSTSDLEDRVKGADITVEVDKYVSFATMEEMIREIVPALNVRRVKDRKVVQVGLQQGIPPSEPLYIIDGIATKDTPYFLSLKPLDLSTIKLVTNPGKLAPLGLMGRSGIVIVGTKSGNARPPIDASRVVTGSHREIPFKQTAHKNTRRPDFRSTIYWKPVVKTDTNGKAVVEFQCSDDLGPIKVRVDGITSDGRPFSGETTLNFVLAENK